MQSDQAMRMGRELTKSAIFKDYEQAFHELTHLSIQFVPAGSDVPIDEAGLQGNPFCMHIQTNSSVCQTCAMMHAQMRRDSEGHSVTARCFAGLTESVVPVKLGDEVIGYLQTGQVLLEQPAQEDLQTLSRKLIEWGVSLKEDEIHDLYLHSTVMPPKQYEAVVRMLEIFARHLSAIVNQTGLDQSEAELEPERIAKARTYISKHLEEPLTLSKVAEAVNTSSFYFSRMFKKVTGHSFTDYLSMTRIEHSKHLMRNHRLNITQIAYESGFQSLSQFNRVFRKLQLESPGQYRKRVLAERRPLDQGA